MKSTSRAAAVIFAVLPLGLAGCGISLPSIVESRAKPEVKTEASVLTVLSSVSLDPIWGPPNDVSKRLVHLLDEETRRASIALLNYEGADADYRLKGELEVVRWGNALKVSYSWRLYDRSGGLSGASAGTESTAARAGGTDLWRQVPDIVLQRIAEKGMEAALSRK